MSEGKTASAKVRRADRGRDAGARGSPAIVQEPLAQMPDGPSEGLPSGYGELFEEERHAYRSLPLFARAKARARANFLTPDAWMGWGIHPQAILGHS